MKKRGTAGLLAVFIVLLAFTLCACTPKIVAPTTEGLTGLSATDTEGNTVTEAVFSDYDLTLVSIWKTTCPNCIAEMPDLADIKTEYANKGVNVIGIMKNAMLDDGSISEDIVVDGKKVMSDTGCNYTQLLPNEQLSTLMNDVPKTPSFVFVDSEGKYVSVIYVGIREKAEVEALIEQARNSA